MFLKVFYNKGETVKLSHQNSPPMPFNRAWQLQNTPISLRGFSKLKISILEKFLMIFPFQSQSNSTWQRMFRIYLPMKKTRSVSMICFITYEKNVFLWKTMKEPPWFLHENQQKFYQIHQMTVRGRRTGAVGRWGGSQSSGEVGIARNGLEPVI